jgi:hypothetical protein
MEMGAGFGSPPAPDGFAPLRTSDEFTPHQISDAQDHMRANVAYCKARGIPTLTWSDRRERTGPLLICGGGPSLKETKIQGELRDLIAKGGQTLAINDTHDWLYERGIVPDMFAMQEIDPWPADFIRHANDHTTYYLASFAHPSAFQRLEGRKVVMFHSYGGIGENEILGQIDPGQPLICGAEAMSIRSINLGWALGWGQPPADLHMFGVDGCYRRDENSHAYMDRKWHAETIIPVDSHGNRGPEFLAPYYLARQADDLRRVVKNLGHLFKLTTHGEGLVQWVHRAMAPEQYRATAS